MQNRDLRALRHAAELLPPLYSDAVLKWPAANRIEELRLRTGQVLRVRTAAGECSLEGLPAITPELLRQVLERATRSSYHAAADSLRQGYVTAPGGCRIGVCGTAAMDRGRILSLRDVSSLAIRVARAHPGIADPLLPELCPEGAFLSTLLLSPPGLGKTTLLRDLIRSLSYRGLRVAVADERGEIAAVSAGQPGYDLGPQTDVLTGAPKQEAVMLLLRIMTPQVLALDEISAEADAGAALLAANCGTALLATVHAASYREAAARQVFASLAAQRVFRRAVTISLKAGVRRYQVEEIG